MECPPVCSNPFSKLNASALACMLTVAVSTAEDKLNQKVIAVSLPVYLCVCEIGTLMTCLLHACAGARIMLDVTLILIGYVNHAGRTGLQQGVCKGIRICAVWPGCSISERVASTGVPLPCSQSEQRVDPAGRVSVQECNYIYKFGRCLMHLCAKVCLGTAQHRMRADCNGTTFLIEG